MNECFVRYGNHDQIALLTTSRPDSRNAIGTHQDCEDFIAALDAAQTETGISCDWGWHGISLARGAGGWIMDAALD